LPNRTARTATTTAGASALVLLLACAVHLPAQAAADPAKVLRVASFDIETFDPQQFNDDPSFQVFVAIFEGMYEYDYLASPPRLAPVTASGPPVITDDGKTWTVRITPGIYFTDDPAFGGKRRELVAEDYVYSLKRWIDPNLRRGGDAVMSDLVVGARAVIDAARKPGAKFDYDQPIEGVRATDRYTLQLRLTEPNFPVIHDNLVRGAVAREVVEAANGDIRARPVGTGPYKLREWRQGSKVILEANPGYRSIRFPENSDPARAALVRSMKGKTLPQIGVVDISLIEEDAVRLLEFEKGGLDYIIVRGEPATRLQANGKLKPELVAKGVTRHTFVEPVLFSVYFNMEDPTIGGMDREHIALRRAVALAIDMDTMVKVVYAGQGMPANQIVPPTMTGYDPALPKKPLFDRAAATRLLDRVGFDKFDAEGFRKGPDGKPLTVTFTIRSGAISRETQTLLKRDMDAVKLRMEFHVTPFQEAVKEMVAGKYQMAFVGQGGVPSGYAVLYPLYGKAPSSINLSRFKLAEYDVAFGEFMRSEDPATQIAAARKMTELAQAYMPMLPAVFRVETNYVQPWLLGFSSPIFKQYWKFLDIDLAVQRKMQGK
jgi:ABC-type transport system substrate-binding protein